ncbi:MAG: hypothetical protein J3K34DRAFT_208808 [Monoraphidium minutum]|nr:MAG: hypothetical protein J3K34DRAFT_208808 [Monoraphidium minutum]
MLQPLHCPHPHTNLPHTLHLSCISTPVPARWQARLPDGNFGGRLQARLRLPLPLRRRRNPQKGDPPVLAPDVRRRPRAGGLPGRVTRRRRPAPPGAYRRTPCAPSRELWRREPAEPFCCRLSGPRRITPRALRARRRRRLCPLHAPPAPSRPAGARAACPVLAPAQPRLP